jgi:hypothetical protein
MEMMWDMSVVVENGWCCDDDDYYYYYCDYDDDDCCCVMRMVKRGWAEKEGNYEMSWVGVEERDSTLSSVPRAKGMTERWCRKDCRDNSSRHSLVRIIFRCVRQRPSLADPFALRIMHNIITFTRISKARLFLKNRAKIFLLDGGWEVQRS